MDVQSNMQSDGRYWVTLEWSMEYNIDVMESLHFFRIIVTTESRIARNIIFREENTFAHDTVSVV